MNTLIFIRHGETDLAGRFCGQIDPPLNAAGNRQAAQVAAVVASRGIVRICSSALLRARQTAEHIAQRSGLAIDLHRELCEISFGAWEGLHWSEIEVQFPSEAMLWAEQFPHRSAPHGESYAEFCSRVDGCIASIMDAAQSPTAIVTHRGVIHRALTRFFGYSEQQARETTATYCSRVEMEIDPARGLR